MTDHEKFIAEADLFEAKNELDQLLQTFNSSFREWEDKHMFGSNFRFEYDKNGRKHLVVSDLAPTDVGKPFVGSVRVREAGLVLDEQLEAVLKDIADQTVDPFKESKEEGSVMIPPEISDEMARLGAIVPTPEIPELEAISVRLDQELRNRVRSSFMAVMEATLSEGDLLLLSALGVDGRHKILDVFIEECQSLKKELNDESGS